VFNAAVGFNAQELNNPGVVLGYKALATNVSATGSVTSAAAFAFRACGYTGSAGVSASSATAVYQIQLSSLQDPNSYSGGYATAIYSDVGTAFQKALFVDSVAATSSILGIARSAILGSFASAGATGTLFVDAVFLDANVTASAATTLASVTRTRIIGGAGSTNTSTTLASLLDTAIMGSSVGAGVSSTFAGLDKKVGTVWHRYLDSIVGAGATAINTIDPKKMLYSSVSTATFGLASTSVGLQKALGAVATLSVFVTTATFGRFMNLSSNASTAISSTALLRALRVSKSSVIATANTTLAKLKRTAIIVPPAVTIGATATAPALKRYADMVAAASAGATATADFRYAVKFFSLFNVATATAAPVTDVRTAIRLGSDATASASSTIDDFINLGVKLFGDATASADADGSTLNAIVAVFGMPVTASATQIDAIINRLITCSSTVSTATTGDTSILWLNIFDIEPSYRTDFVAKEDFTNAVSVEDFTVAVKDDNYTMKTFTKQPSEVLGYDIDMTAWFDPLVDDYIVAAPAPAVTITPAVPGDTTLTCTEVIRIGDPCYIVKVWLSGGTSGNSYKVTTVLNTHDGRVKEIDFTMMVQEI